jgi:hypothetical protein
LRSGVRFIVIELYDGAPPASSSIGLFRVAFGLSQRGVAERSHDVVSRDANSKTMAKGLSQAARLAIERQMSGETDV